MDDLSIIRLIKKEPSDGLRAVLLQYGGFLKAVTVNILGIKNREDIEECMSDTLVKLWRSINRFDEKRADSLKAYLGATARNTAINKRRTLGKQPDVSLERETADNFDMDEELIGNINKTAVTGAIDALPEPDRTIFIRRYYGGVPVKTIARELGLDAKTVENKLHRKKASLKRELFERGVVL